MIARRRSSIWMMGIIVLLLACQAPRNYPNHQILRFNIAEGITSLDPAFARSIEAVSISNQLFNGLVTMDQNQKVIPDLAKSWEILDSNRLYRFTLKQNIYFHKNGCFGEDSTRTVNAHDVEYSLKRLVNPQLLSPGKWVMNPVNLKGEDIDIQAVNDSIVEIRLKKAFPPFLGILGMKYCSVLPQEAVKYYGDDFRAHPVGTGPFLFKYWKENTKLVLRKNPDYHVKDELGQNLPYLDALSVSFIKDEEVVFLKFLKGEIHFMTGLKGAYKDELLTPHGQLNKKYASRIDFLKLPFLNTEYLGFNLDSAYVQNSPLRLKKVRQAINYGFDREKMLKYLRNGIGRPAHSGFVPKGLPSYDEEKIKGYTFQPEKAMTLLQEAGFDKQHPLPEINISTTSQYLDICEYLQHQLGEVGIPINIEVNPAATNNELIAFNKVAFFRKSWVADYPDGENYLALFYSANFSPEGPNYTHYKNEDYDALFEQALKHKSDTQRIEVYQQLDQMLIKDAPIVPLFYDEVVCFSSKQVKDIAVSPMKVLDFSQTRIGH